jgi:hypothetical protein
MLHQGPGDLWFRFVPLLCGCPGRGNSDDTNNAPAHIQCGAGGYAAETLSSKAVVVNDLPLVFIQRISSVKRVRSQSTIRFQVPAAVQYGNQRARLRAWSQHR